MNNNHKKSKVSLEFTLIFKLQLLLWQSSTILLNFHTDRPLRPLRGKTSKKQKKLAKKKKKKFHEDAAMG